MLGISPTFDYVRSTAKTRSRRQGSKASSSVKVCNALGAVGVVVAVDVGLGSVRRCLTAARGLPSAERCWMAADLAQLDDLAAVALVFERGDELVGFVRATCREGVVAERARAVPAYRNGSRRSCSSLTDGNLIDLDRIEADIRADCKRFDVQQIVFDQFGSAQIAAVGRGRTQGDRRAEEREDLHGPSRELETRVKHRRFRHDGNSLVKWAASNVVVTRRIDDSILPKKESAESPNKIDPIDALLQAIGAWLRSAVRTEPQFQIYILGGAKGATV
jgi:phage terminase large subunit-like protein